MTARPKPVNRHVYVIGPETGLQKVGMATDPKARLAALQTASPFDLIMHLSIAVPFGDAPVIERRAHRLLIRSCVRNEWFETTPAEAVAAVRKAVEGIVRPALASAPSTWRFSRPYRSTWSPPDPEALRQVLVQRRATNEGSLPLFAFGRSPVPQSATYRLEARCSPGAIVTPVSMLPAGGWHPADGRRKSG